MLVIPRSAFLLHLLFSFYVDILRNMRCLPCNNLRLTKESQISISKVHLSFNVVFQRWPRLVLHCGWLFYCYHIDSRIFVHLCEANRANVSLLQEFIHKWLLLLNHVLKSHRFMRRLILAQREGWLSTQLEGLGIRELLLDASDCRLSKDLFWFRANHLRLLDLISRDWDLSWENLVYLLVVEIFPSLLFFT